MKKQTIILIILALLTIGLVKSKEDKVMIPKEAIRIRIVANSNSDKDINAKIRLKEDLEQELYKLLKDAKSIEEARFIINNNLERLDLIVDDKIDYDYKLAFGTNYFPRKVYKGIVYDEGNYESLVVTLGSGVGDNWWCVLFPPLCLLDGNENTQDVEYKFLVKELLDKYWPN